ncbi:hypothetical protein ACEPAI_2545 [Sanghuangporus weigelae]
MCGLADACLESAPEVQLDENRRTPAATEKEETDSERRFAVQRKIGSGDVLPGEHRHAQTQHVQREAPHTRFQGIDKLNPEYLSTSDCDLSLAVRQKTSAISLAHFQEPKIPKGQTVKKVKVANVLRFPTAQSHSYCSRSI